MPRAAHGVALLVSVLALALTPAVASAAPAATLTAKLQPLKLGAPTAVTVAFHLRHGRGEALPALRNFALRMPPGMGITASELGLATCSPLRLLERGIGGCPAESLMGNGSAQVQVPFGIEVVRERAPVSIFMAQPVAEQTTTLFYFDGRKPVIAPFVLRSQVVTPEGSSDSVLDTPVEAIPTTPDGPEMSLVSMRSTIGPASLRYYRRDDGRRVPYRPEGMSCRRNARAAASASWRASAFATAAGPARAPPCPVPRRQLAPGDRADGVGAEGCGRGAGGSRSPWRRWLSSSPPGRRHRLLPCCRKDGPTSR